MSRRKRARRGAGCIFRQPGCKTWTIKFVSRGGKSVREATGMTDYSEAQQLLIKRLEEVRTGSLLEPEARKAKVSDLAEAFLRDYRINRRKSVEHPERRWKKHLEPFFGTLHVADVGSTLIEK